MAVVGLARAVVTLVVDASSSLQALWGNCCSGAPVQHVPSLSPSLGRPSRSQQGQIVCGPLPPCVLGGYGIGIPSTCPCVCSF